MSKTASTFGSGIGAISSVFNLLDAGDHVVTTEDLYGVTHTFLKKVASRLKITSTFVEECTDVINIVKEIKENTKVRYCQL